MCVMCVLVAKHACASGEERGEMECLCTQDVCAKGGLKGYAVIVFFFNWERGDVGGEVLGGSGHVDEVFSKCRKLI